VFEQRRVACACCQGVKVERLDWLAQNPRYTHRFAHHVGILCRDMSNKKPWLTCCTCTSTRSKTWTPSTCGPGWPKCPSPRRG
jgi:hypothetical protein